MYILRPKENRGKTKTKWLKSRHTFSFAEYLDFNNMGFGDLRVINDDYVAPGYGFDIHKHENMEIISIVLEGELEHKDNMGNGSVIKRGEIQRISAGSGVMHTETNLSGYQEVHFLQIWVLPDVENIKPEYEQKKFDLEKMKNKLCLIVSNNGRDGSLTMHQDIEIFQTIIESEQNVKYKVQKGRKVWIHVAEGSVEIKSELMEGGDGMAIWDEEDYIHINGIDKESNVLMFNLRG